MTSLVYIMVSASSSMKRLCSLLSAMRIVQQVLMVRVKVKRRFVWCVVVPLALQRSLVVLTHSQGHLGVMKTLARLRSGWYWYGMVSCTRRIVRMCLICHKFAKMTKHAMYPVHVPQLCVKAAEEATSQSGVSALA